MEEVIGYPGREISQRAAHDIRLSRAGGGLCLWKCIPSEVVTEIAACKTCKSPRSPVFQAYAPAADGSLAQRVLILMVCVNQQCCGSEHAFTAFRCQLQGSGQDEAQDDSRSIQEQHHHSWGDVKWGKSQALSTAQKVSHGSSNLEASRDASSMYDNLIADMDALLQPSASDKQTVVSRQIHQDGVETMLHTPGALLPAFVINFDSIKRGKVAGPDSDHVQKLLEEYRQSAEDCDFLSVNNSKWKDVEEYEEPDAITKFMEELSLHPTQCARYGRPLRPLSPGAEVIQPACPHCGAPRQAELQVLSPLWHFMEEAHSWDVSGGHTTTQDSGVKALQHPKWDWVSVVVYTCTQSCQMGDKRWFIAEEEVSAYNLADCIDDLADWSLPDVDIDFQQGVSVDIESAMQEMKQSFPDGVDLASQGDRD